MADGLIIMLVGMGVVFLFLIVLMAYIRLLGVRRETAPDTPSEMDAGSDAGATGQEGIVRRIAAIAVAMELARSRPPQPSLPSDGPNAWRSTGRIGLQQGPLTVAEVLTSRRRTR